jgi:hypothetical protein
MGLTLGSRCAAQLILWDIGPWGAEGTMKKTRRSEEQIVEILREAGSAPVLDVV